MLKRAVSVSVNIRKAFYKISFVDQDQDPFWLFDSGLGIGFFSGFETDNFDSLEQFFFTKIL